GAKCSSQKKEDAEREEPLDAVLRCPMEEALAGLRLEDSLTNALLGQGTGALGHLHTLLEAYENADRIRVCAIAQDFRLDAADVRDSYFTAVSWADQAGQGLLIRT